MFKGNTNIIICIIISGELRNVLDRLFRAWQMTHTWIIISAVINTALRLLLWYAKMRLD